MSDDNNARLGVLETVSKYRPQIMGFAAMWIFIFHVRDEALLFFHVPYINRIEIFFNNIGFCGVDVFLFLSGWGLYYALKKRNLNDFYKRRYRRLIPPFVLVCVVKALFENWEFMKFFRAVTCWSFFAEYIHIPIWFIPAIAVIYLFYPLYNKAFDKFSNKYIFTAASLMLWFALAFAGMILFNREDVFGFVNRIPVFIVGVLFGWMAYNRKKIPGKAAAAVIFLMLIGGFQLQYYCTFRNLKLLFPLSNSSLPAFLIGISMCFASAYCFKLLGKVKVIQKVYGFMGEMTLELYAAQEIVMNILRSKNIYPGALIEKHLYALLIFLFSLGGGYLLHLLMTMVFNKLDGKPVFTSKTAK
ncbi:MAG: acyltransferase [Clostridiales bacterium]|nr:acyltransferase [Clostridiales bacterium]